LLDFAAGNDEIDYSQERTNLTNSAPALVEATSARTAFTTRREIAMVLQVTNTDTGYLLDHGDNLGNYSYRMRIAVAGTVRFQENGSIIASVAIPDLAAGERNILFHWSQFADGSSVRSEFLLYNFTAGTYTFSTVTHAATTPDPADTFTVNGTADGEVGFSGGLADWVYLRIGRRFHSTTEAKEDWVSTTAAGSTTQMRPDAVLVPERTTLTGLAADGAFVGPEYLWAGHAYTEASRRLVGALVNVQARDLLTLNNDYNLPSTAWWRLAPQATDLHMIVTHLCYRPIPTKVNRANVRIFVDLSSAGTTCTVQYRCYCMTGLPMAGEKQTAFEFRRTAEVQDSTDHDGVAAAGEWLSLGALQLLRDDWGCAFFALAISFDHDSSSANADGTDLTIKSWIVEPYYEEGEDGMDVLSP
jgi:hypothetical protein